MFKSVFVSAKFLKCRGHASGLEEFVRPISESSGPPPRICALLLISYVETFFKP
jgi:hypothetical protein